MLEWRVFVALGKNGLVLWITLKDEKRKEDCAWFETQIKETPLEKLLF